MIYFDSTEGRQDTRLPEAVRQAGQAITGLEAATGADLLISTLNTPKLPSKLTDSKLHRLALRKHIEMGALCQRKSNTDFTNSIPNLPNIIRRMRETGCDQCWLYIDADLKRSRDNMCVVNGRNTQWSWNAIRGARIAWELRGGFIYESPYENEMIGWIDTIMDWLRETQANPVKQLYNRLPQQILTGPDWRSVLCALPGIGPDTAGAIADYCDTLGNALCMLSDPAQAGVIPGVGKGRIAGVRRVMRLPEGVVLGLTTGDKSEDGEIE